MFAEKNGSLFTCGMVESSAATADEFEKPNKFRWRNILVDRCVAVGIDAQRMAWLISSATTPAVSWRLIHERVEPAWLSSETCGLPSFAIPRSLREPKQV